MNRQSLLVATVLLLLVSLASAACVNLTNTSTYQGQIVNTSTGYFINQSVTLCTGTYSRTGVTMLTFNNSNLVLDCNGSTLIGNFAANTYGINTNNKVNLSASNCIFQNFVYGLNINANNSNFTNITAYNSSTYGFFLTGATEDQLINCTANESGQYDLMGNAAAVAQCNHVVQNMVGSGGRPINYTNSSVTWSDFAASEILLCNADGSSLSNITINGSDTLGNNGLGAFWTDNANISNSVSAGNYYGFWAQFSTNLTMWNNTATQNRLYGIYLASTAGGATTGINLYNTTLYNNNYDLSTSRTTNTLFYTMYNTSFLNSSGGTASSTFFSLINDTTVGAATSTYAFNWSASQTLPNGYRSFGSRFINITKSGTISIDKVTWYWTDADLSGYNESNLVVVAYNGATWSQPAATLSTSANTLSITNLATASNYGLAEFNCVNLSDPQTYGTKVVNTSNSFYINSNVTLCTDTYYTDGSQTPGLIKINAAKITLDCNGSILISTSPGSGTGIYLSEANDNDIVKNCQISGFLYGVYALGLSNNYIVNTTLQNLTVNNSYYYNMELHYLNNSKIQNNTLRNTTLYNGIYLATSDNNTISGNNITESGAGYAGLNLYTSNKNLVYNNFFNNSINAISDTTTNYFNGSRNCSATNIMGGSCTGGNYWADATGIDHGLGPGPNYNTSGDGIADDLGYYIYTGAAGAVQGIDYLTLATATSGCATPSSTDGTVVVGNATFCTVSRNFTSPSGIGNINFASGATSLDCNGSTFASPSLGANTGLYLNEANDNLVIKNCRIVDFLYGVYALGLSNNYIVNTTLQNLTVNNSYYYNMELHYLNNSKIQNNTLRNTTLYNGIYLATSDNNTISGNNITESGDGYAGLNLYTSNNNLIYNNYFKNSVNAISDTAGNNWNTTKTLGTSIMGGPYLGGNYWSDYNGTDSNGDAIGDIEYNITTYGTDYLPLVAPVSVDISFVSPTDNSTVYNRTFIQANVSSSDANLTNLTIYLYNSTGGLVNSSSSATSPLFANFTGLAEGIYYLNATANATGNHSGNTETRTIRIRLDTCVNLSDSDTYATFVVKVGNTFYVNNNTVLCTDRYTAAGSMTSLPLIAINKSGIILDCNGSKLVSPDSAGYGINLSGTHDNVLVKNCFLTHFTYGVDAEGLSTDYINNLTLQNVTVNDTVTYYGFYFYYVNNSRVTDSTLSYNAGTYALYLSYADNNTISSTSFYGTTAYHTVRVENSNWNNFTNCSFTNNTGTFNVLLYYANNNILTGNNFTNSSVSYPALYLYTPVTNNLIYNNYFNNTINAYSSEYPDTNQWNITKTAGTNIMGGPYLGGNFWSDYTGNDTDGDGLGNVEYNISAYGADYLPLVGFTPGDNCPVINASYTMNASFNGAPNNGSCTVINASNIVLNCAGYNLNGNGSGYGIDMNGKTNITISNCHINNYAQGIHFTSINDSLIRNNTIFGSNYGIYIDPSYNNTIINNTLYNNSVDGLFLQDSHNNTIENNTAYDNTNAGFYLNISSDNNLTNNTAYGNQYGIYLNDSGNNKLVNMHLYNHSGSDFYVAAGAAAQTVYLTNVSFDNPVGNYTNYTSINISDSVDANTEYTITWASEPATLPNDTLSFNQKYVNISAVVGAVSIDTISFHWTDDELGSFDESRLELWKYNGSWNSTDAVLSPSTNTLTLTNMDPASTYGILENNQPTDCPHITASGTTFTMANNFVGSPNYISDLAMNACVWIEASNVTFDCNGYNITGNTTLGATAAFILYNATGVSNITVKNCPGINNYTAGMIVVNTSDSILTNNTAYGNSFDGITFYTNSTNNRIEDTVVHDNARAGFYISGDLAFGCLNNNLTNNLVYGNGEGFVINGGSTGNLLINNTVYGSATADFDISGSDSTVLLNNTAYGSPTGLTITDSNDVNVSDMYFYNHTTDLQLSSSGISRTFSLQNGTFDNPVGNLSDYMNINITDSIDADTAYQVTWSGQPAALPPGTNSFAQKYVNISAAGATSIDTISFQWLDGEIGSHNESKFEVWKYNGDWSLTNATLDAGANTFTFTGLNPASTYAILENEVGNCPYINESGTYTLNYDQVGAPNYIAAFDAYACIWIDAPNVTLDCNGYNLTNNGTFGSNGALGVLFNGLYVPGWGLFGQATNVTLKNCPNVSEYSIGVMTLGSSGNFVYNNTFFNNSDGGVQILDPVGGFPSDYNVVENNTIFSNLPTSATGITVGAAGPCSYNNFSNNVIYSNDNGVFITAGSIGNLFVNNSVYANVNKSFLISDSFSTILVNNTLADGEYGLYIANSNETSAYNTHFYNHSINDLFVFSSAGGNIFTMQNGTFDNVSGDMLTYTSINITDVVDAGTSYQIVWAEEPDALPVKVRSFAGKYVNITGGGPIDSISFLWNSDEVTAGGYDESKFKLWKYSGGWSNTNAALNTSEHSLTLANMSPSSTYGIVEDNETANCPQITASDITYVMERNYVGAPGLETFSGAANISYCVEITGSNVVFDCAGYNITNNGTFSSQGAAGIVVYGASNVTVQNCPGINNYTFGIAPFNGSNSFFLNNTVYSNTHGFYVDAGSNNNLFDNNIMHDNTGRGFTLAGNMGASTGNNITNSVAYSNGVGFRIGTGSHYTQLVNDTVYGNSGDGFDIRSSNNTAIINSSSYGNSQNGVSLTNNAFFATLDSNNFSGNSQYGVYVTSSRYNTISNSTMTGNSQQGIYFSSALNNNVSDSNISGNNNNGIEFYSSSNGNLIQNSIITGNTQHGVFLSASANNTVSGNNITENSRSGISIDSSDDNIFTNNNLSKNSFTMNYWRGFDASNSNRNQILNNIVDDINYSVGGYEIGIYLANCTYTNITNNSVSRSSGPAIQLERGCNYNNLVNNTIDHSASQGIFLYHNDSFNTIRGNNITNDAQYSIHLFNGSSNNTITGNYIANGANVGINVQPNWVGAPDADDYRCLYNNISYNTIDNTSSDAIVISYGNGSSLIGNNISNIPSNGITILASPDSRLISNRIVNTSGSGILMGFTWQLETGSEHAIVQDNIIDNVSANGIMLTNCSHSNITGNNISNAALGIAVVYSTNVRVISNRVINATTNYGIQVGWNWNSASDSPYAVIQDNYIDNAATIGIQTAYSSYSNITSNNISNSQQGIEVTLSNNTRVIANRVLNMTSDGIRIGYSWDANYAAPYTLVEGNYVYNMSNNNPGIRADYSPYSNITYNIIDLTQGDGISTTYSHNSSVIGNNISSVKYNSIDIGASPESRIISNKIVNGSGSGFGIVVGFPWALQLGGEYTLVQDNSIDSLPNIAIMMSNSSYSNVTGNNISNTSTGIDVAYGTDMRVISNRIINVTVDGIRVGYNGDPNSAAPYTIVEGNYIYNMSNNNPLIRTEYSPYSNITYNVLDLSQGDGMSINYGPNSSVIGNNLSNIKFNNIIILASPESRVISNRIVNGVGTGFGIVAGFPWALQTGSEYVLVQDNTIDNLPNTAIMLANSSYSNVTGNNISNTSTGIVVSYATDMQVISNRVLNVTNEGIRIGYDPASGPAPYTVVQDNYVGNAVAINGPGINGTNADYVNVTNNTVYGFAFGIVQSYKQGWNIVNNTVYGNTGGIWLQGVDDNGGSLSGNTLYNNSLYGTYVDSPDSDIALTNDHFYNNGHDLQVYDVNNRNYVFTSLIFDNPAGNYANYTNLSIYDTMNGGVYTINWSAQPPGALPSNRISVANMYVNISTTAGSVSIDSINWTWNGINLTGYNESKFELWNYTGTWASDAMNDTPDTVNHIIGLSNLVPGTIYALLQGEFAGCPVIKTSGTYTMTNNYQGAPNSAGPLSGNTCVKIAASNVVFDCDGYNITNNGTGGTTYGIVLNGSLTNVTVMNCHVANYTNGLYSQISSNNQFINNTFYYNTYGMYVNSGSNNNLTDNLAYNNTATGFYIASSSNNLTNNSAYYNTQYGFYLGSGSNNVLANNTAYKTQNAFYISAGNNFFIGNFAYNNTQNGFYLASGGNTLTDNFAFNNTQAGFYLPSSSNNNLTGNTAYNNVYPGFYFYLSSNNNLINNSAYNNRDEGIYFFATCDNNILTGNLAYNNSGSGFYLQSSPNNNTLINNSAYDNHEHGFRSQSGSNNTFIDNSAHDNSVFGFYLHYASNTNTLTNNTAYNNSAGFDFDGTLGNNLTDNLVYNNNYGLRIVDSDGIRLTNTHAFNNGFDVYLETSTSPMTIYLNNITFDNPSGSMENYTSIYLIDTIGTGTTYWLNWSAQPSGSLPGGRVSVANKYLEISNATGVVSIDLINWTWNDGEISGLNKSRFELWNYTNAWAAAPMNNTPDTVNNVLGASNLVPGTIYALLQNNDSTVTVQFVPPTDNSSTTVNRTYILVNVTSSSIFLENITVNLYDDLGNLINSSNSSTSPLFVNFTGLADGLYYFNATAYTDLGSDNSTETRNVTIDTTPPELTIQSPANTSYNSTNVSLNYTVSPADSCWYVLNAGAATPLPGCANTTFIAVEGGNNITVYANDSVNNINSSIVYFTVDTIPPEIQFVAPTDSSGIVTRDYIEANVTATDTDLSNITIYLYDSSGNLVDSATSATSPLFANFTGLMNAFYYLNATAYDSVGNMNKTETRTIQIITSLDSCRAIFNSGRYNLSANIATNESPGYDGVYACIAIYAPDVELDCAGHTINYLPGSYSIMGVYIFDNYTHVHNVTVKNCVISNFYRDAYFNLGADGITLQNNTLRGSSYFLVDSTDSNNANGRFLGNTFVGPTSGELIYFTDISDNTFENNSFHNGTYIALHASNTILRTNITGNTFNNVTYGIWAADFNQTKISGNQFTGPVAIAIYTLAIDNVVISSNNFSSNQAISANIDTIQIARINHSTITDNIIQSPNPGVTDPVRGILTTPGAGVEDSNITNNQFLNTSYYEIYAAAPASNVRIVNNTIVHYGGTGESGIFASGWWGGITSENVSVINNTIYGYNTPFGAISLQYFNNPVVTGNRLINDSTGMATSNIDGGLFANNSFFNASSGADGILMVTSGNVTFADNYFENTDYANALIRIYSSSGGFNITNNLAINGSGSGLVFEGGPDNIISNNRFYNLLAYGIQSSNDINNTIISNNIIEGSRYGMSLTSASGPSNNVTISYNNISNCSIYGLSLGQFTNSTISHNRIVNMSGSSIPLYIAWSGSTDGLVNISDNYIYGTTTGDGIWLSTFYGPVLFSNNWVEKINGSMGMYVTAVDGLIMDNVTFINASDSAAGSKVISFSGSSNATVSNLTIRGGVDGVYLESLSNNNTFSDVLITGTEYGFSNMQANNTYLSNAHLYNNTFALYRYGYAGYAFNGSGVVIDRPAGDYKNYTNLSIYDVSDSYWQLAWVAAPTPLRPPARYPIAYKYVNITNPFGGSYNLTSIVWHWTVAEAAGKNESNFKVFNYTNGRWSTEGYDATVDEANHQLTITDFYSTGTIFGLFEESFLAHCPTVPEAGDYAMELNYTGVQPTINICLIINASDVVFDCAGFSLTGNASNQYGVVIPGRTNVILKNCIVSNYTDAITLNSTNSSQLLNNTVFDNSGYGVFLDPSVNNTLFSNYVYRNGLDGVRLEDSHDNTFRINLAYNNSQSGFALVDSTGNKFTGDKSYNNSEDGFSFSSSNDSVLSLVASYNNNYGFNLQDSQGNYFGSTTSHGNVLDGFLLVNSPSNNFVGSSGWGNQRNGFTLMTSDSNNVNGSFAYGNTEAGIAVLDSNNNIIAGTAFYGNTYDFYANATGAPLSYTMDKSIFRNPSGSTSDAYTTLSIVDSVSANSAYFVNWSALPATRPQNRSSFMNEFVVIEPQGTVSIDTIVWHWTDTEAAPYDENKFELWKYNSSSEWENVTGVVIDIIANTLTVLGFDPASGYGPMQNLLFVPVTLNPMNITNSTDLIRWEPNATNTTTSPTKGGNITGLPSLSGDMLTDRWAAFYGTVGNAIYLTDNSSSIADYMYVWPVLNITNGVVCVSPNATLSTFYTAGANAVDIDQAWGFDPEAMDSAINTYTGTNCSLNIGGQYVNNSAYADTGAAGGFKTCAIKTNDHNPITKPSLVFCSQVISNGTSWNNGTADYEIMVPTSYGAGTETYYFYANLN